MAPWHVAPDSQLACSPPLAAVQPPWKFLAGLTSGASNDFLRAAITRLCCVLFRRMASLLIYDIKAQA